MTDAETLERIKDRLRDKQFGDVHIEIVIETVETEITGGSDRNPEYQAITGSDTVPRGSSTSGRPEVSVSTLSRA